MSDILVRVAMLIFLMFGSALLVRAGIRGSQAKKEREAAELAAAKERFDKAPFTHHCMTCGSDLKEVSGPARGAKGVEVAVWAASLGAGLVYSVWRRVKGGKRTCPVCSADTVVPITSPAAVAHRKALA